MIGFLFLIFCWGANKKYKDFMDRKLYDKYGLAIALYNLIQDNRIYRKDLPIFNSCKTYWVNYYSRLDDSESYEDFTEPAGVFEKPLVEV